MKCIKKDGVITRVSDDKAKAKVATGAFTYVPKHEWKEQNRFQQQPA